MSTSHSPSIQSHVRAIPVQRAPEAAWLPTPPAGVADLRLATTVDIAALGLAAHGAIRPAALLPVEASADDPFVAALRRIEFESSRLI
ncbi:hypothetical protein [Bradyrhizobium sp. USDA 4506]